MMSLKNWYVLRSKPHKENQVYARLQISGIETYYPCIKVKPVNPRCSTIRPYFPGYMFVYAALEFINSGTLQWLPGTVGLLRFGDMLATVPDGFIKQLRQRIDYINQTGGLTLDGLKPGDRVQITGGPFAGFEAIFDTRLGGRDRVRVLLDLLGRLVNAEIDARDIARLRQN
jgi:transcriptional antiterminator RfaH